MIIIKIKKLLFKISIISIISIICFTFSIGSILANLKRDNTQILLTSESNNSSIQFTKKIEDGLFHLDKTATFKIRAFVEPIEEVKYVISETKHLEIVDKQIECKDFPCHQNWIFDLSDHPFKMNNSSHLLFSWDQAIKSSMPNIMMDLETEDKELNTAYIAGYFNGTSEESIREIKTINMKNVEYTKASYAYFAKRELGFRADKKWRYRKLDGKTVLQARVDIPLRDVQIVQLLLNSGYSCERIQFSVDTTGNGRRDHFVLSEHTRVSQEVRNNYFIHTVDISNVLNHSNYSSKKAVLMEVILFMDGITPATYLKEKPIHKIIFNKIALDYEKKTVIPKLNKVGRMHFLDFGLSDAKRNNSQFSSHLKKISISIRMNEPQSLLMEKILLCNLEKHEVPKIAYAPQNFLKTWGKTITLPYQFYNIKSFNPLLWFENNKNKIKSNEISLHAQLSNSNYEDTELKIAPENYWYNLKKRAGGIQVEGVSFDPKSYLNLKLKPLQENTWLTFKFDQGTEIKSPFKSSLSSWLLPSFDSVFSAIELESLDQKKIGLPLFFFLGKNKLYLEKGAELSLKIGRVASSDGVTRDLGSLPKKWTFLIGSQPNHLFSDAEYPNKLSDTAQWLLPDQPTINRIWPIVSDESVLDGQLVIKQNGEKKKIPVHFNPHFEECISIKKNSEILDFRKNVLSSLSNNTENSDMGFFDIEIDNTELEYDFKKKEWWLKESELLFIPLDSSIKVDKQREKAYLFVNDKNNYKWIFTIPNVEFIKAISFIPSGTVLSNIKLSLKYGNKSIKISQNEEEIFLASDSFQDKNIFLELEYVGPESFLSFNLPKLRVLGLKQTPKDELSKLYLSVDGNSYTIKGDFPKHNGAWYDLDSISLGKGEHSIQFESSPYFNFKAILLETKEQLSWPSIEDEPQTSALQNTIILSLKLLCFASLMICLYIYRNWILHYSKYYYGLIKLHFINPYLNMHNGLCFLFWSGMSILFFWISLFYKVEFENYWASFGGIFVVLICFHLSRIIKSYIQIAFPKSYLLIYKNNASPFFFWALILLFITAILAAAKIDPIAEQFGNIVYYLLFVGTIIEIQYLYKQQNE